MEVSVIIAVYNAAPFLAKAVESALLQSETEEVILVEDGSLDKSLEVCRHLEAKYNKVKLFQHKGGINKGAPASFNLGITKSRFPYISILGADDYFLPGRFIQAKKIFEDHPECEGVYEALGIHFDNEKSRMIWMNSRMSNIGITTMTKLVAPDDLFEELIIGSSGYFSLNSLTLRKKVIEKVGLMNEKLLLHQDTDFIFRLAAVAYLMPGQLTEPVSIRRVHTQNRISATRSFRQEYKNRMLMWMSTYRWLKEKKKSEKQAIVFNHLVRYCMKTKHYDSYFEELIPEKILKRLRLLLFTIEHPEIFFQSSYFSKYLPSKKQFWQLKMR